MTIFIGGAWPYANGPLHLGHLASLLPGDVLARYYRMKGEDVLYVSGSDCHGTPIAIRAEKEGVPPERIADAYHREFADCFQKLGFSYDLYTRTDSEEHRRYVQELFLRLLGHGWLVPRTVDQLYCPDCSKFLPDRYVEGLCPRCGAAARGDQCEACQTVLDATDLLERACKLCGAAPEIRRTEHYYLRLSALQEELERYAAAAEGWRENAVQLTQRYLAEGLPDRAATRDLPWGIDVPVPGFEGKKIYVWIEAVSGYWTASRQWAKDNGRDWQSFWKKGGGVRSYYVHGKDNIPFHSVILPALLLGAARPNDESADIAAGAAAEKSSAEADAEKAVELAAKERAPLSPDWSEDDELRLPDRIVSGEYLTLEGKKISTSRGWAVWVPDVLERYEPDSLRYFLLANSPEKHDGDFSWHEFIRSHNGELVNAFGNFVHRSLVFVEKAYGGRVPEGKLDEAVREEIEALYARVGASIEDAELKRAIEDIFRFVRGANKYFDERKPWSEVRNAPEHAADTLYTCVQIAANLARLLAPFLPFACEKLERFWTQPADGEKARPSGGQADSAVIGRSEPDLAAPCWAFREVPAGTPFGEIKPLFARIDTTRIAEESDRLKAAFAAGADPA
ncbi:methionine--tRNA ligase [Gorillibacterium sp. sgz500922]|uniref:methionine--tRNA ligase n=1 Tax=Gorillibacterium sp. sgz500922 TaxID=3446694 RepID=UPI003F66C202